MYTQFIVAMYEYIYSQYVVCTYINICKYPNGDKDINWSLTTDFALVNSFNSELES